MKERRHQKKDGNKETTIRKKQRFSSNETLDEIPDFSDDKVQENSQVAINNLVIEQEVNRLDKILKMSIKNPLVFLSFPCNFKKVI